MAGKSRITFLSKKPIVCPVCESKFFREDLLTGRGRLIAGNLTDELRRNYEPTPKYGEVFPLIYPVLVCSSCYYATYAQDFMGIDDDARSKIDFERDKRAESIAIIFDDLDFGEPRRLQEGVASYYFALMCYEHLGPEVAPTFKRALSAIRAAWLCNDLHKRLPQENNDKLARLFYRKATFFYQLTVSREQKGEELLDGVKSYGPDIDKNYGFDGILYLNGLLEHRHGLKQNKQRRLMTLEKSKRYVSRVFGMGKASKAKPSAILDKARKLYEKMTEEIEQLQEEVGEVPAETA